MSWDGEDENIRPGKFSMKESIMCDYSLETYRTTPARTGETYETYRFPSSTVGFVDAGDKETAVCMSCDTRLIIEQVPEFVREKLGIGPREEVTFVRLEEGPHRDGVRFANGQEINLQRLGPGVKAYVLDALDGETKIVEEAATTIA